MLLEILKWSFRGAGWRQCSEVTNFKVDIEVDKNSFEIELSSKLKFATSELTRILVSGFPGHITGNDLYRSVLVDTLPKCCVGEHAHAQREDKYSSQGAKA